MPDIGDKKGGRRCACPTIYRDNRFGVPHPRYPRNPRL